jgi:hypothetical protein
MNKTEYIFAKPQYVAGVGNIYPVRLKDYDDFQECGGILYISKKHFGDSEHPLLDMLFSSLKSLALTEQQLINKLTKLFSIVLREEVFFGCKDKFYGFLVDHERYIDKKKYEQVREIIMKQNLMFEQKVYKNKLVQEWAEAAMEAKMKNTANITIEDMITTVSVVKGKDYDEMQEKYTIYQLYADFYRIRKIKKFDTDTLFCTVSNEVTVEDFAESLDLFKNPYDDLFVSKDKLKKLDSVMSKK